MSKRFLLAGLAIGIIGFVYACTLRDVTGVGVGSIEVQPASVTLLEGGRQTFTAQAKDASGNLLPSGAVTWSTDAQSVFSIDADGNGEAQLSGQTTIWANLDGTRGSAVVTVSPGPSFTFDQPDLEFFGNLGGSAPEPLTVEITNGGGGSLGGISAAVQYPQGSVVGWLSLALAGTSTPTTLTISILIGLLDQGTHTADLILTSQDARNSPVTIPVQVVVSLDRPIIGLSPRDLEIQAEAGGVPSPMETVQIENRGGGVLSEITASPLYLGIGGWLSASLTGTTAPTELNLQADPMGLTPGTYNAEVRVTGLNALNTPQSVGVAFTVVEALGADVTLEKTGPEQASTGDELVYVLTVSNVGPGTARNVILTDTLPPGISFTSASSGGTQSGGVVQWTLGNLVEGNTTVDSVRVTAETTGVRTNVAVVSLSSDDSQPSNNRSTLTTTVTGADLAVAKSAPATASAGDRITYRLSAQNLGPVDAEDVFLTDTLPSGVTFVSATGGGTYNAGAGINGVVRWALGDLTPAAGAQSFQVQVDIGAGASGVLRNVAALEPAQGDPDPANNRQVATTGLGASAELVLVKTAPATGTPGEQITYGLNLQNNGPSNATTVVLSDTLPSGVTFVSATGGGVFDGAAGPNGVVTWDVGALSAAGLIGFDVVVDIDAATTGAIVNTALITSGTPELDLSDNLATAATTVTGSDLAVGKTGPATAAPGETIGYKVTLENTGPSDAAGVVLTDTLPAAVTFVSASGGGVHDGAATGGVVTWTIGDLAVADGLQSFDVSATVADGAAGLITNVAAATATSTDPDPSDNLATTPTDVQRSDLSVVKTGPVTAAPGAELTYALTLQNAGPTDGTGVVLTDTLPATAVFVSADRGGAHDGSPAGGVVTWDVGALAVAAGAQLFSLTLATGSDASGPIDNAAEVSGAQFDPAAGNNYSRVTTTLVPSTDLAVGKSGPGSALPGEQITYSVTVQNLGPSDAEGVALTDRLPAGLTFVSATGGGTYNALGDSVTWNVASLSVDDGLQTFDLVVDIDAGTTGTVINTIEATSTTPDPVPGNNQATTPTSVSGADLSLDKTGPAAASPGEKITYTLTLQNTGPSAAGGVVVTDTLPAGVTFVSATGGGSYNATGDTVTWNVGTLTVADGPQIFQVEVDVDAGTVGDIVNEASVTSTTDDPDPSDDGGSTTTTVTSADLAIRKSATDDGTPAVGEQVTYTLEVQNVGPSTATGVLVTDTLPAGVSFVSATGGATHNAVGDTVTWSVGTLSVADGAQSIDIVVTFDAAGSQRNAADIRASTHDPTTPNNRDAVSTTVAALSPTLSTATVPATGTAGTPTDIAIQARDSNGDPMSVGGETVEVTVSGANTVATFTATDVGDGTYTASYPPTNTGDDNIVITMNTTAISGSPFTSTVVAGGVSPANSTATVPGVGEAGTATNITVQARDTEGNAIGVGGEDVEITVSGANTVAAFAATDVGDGTYTASYTPTALGDDNIVITMNTTAISGSPFTSTVGVGPLSPANSTATVPGTGSAGVVTNITVQARDSEGNAIGVGGEDVEITVSGANTVAAFAATDVGDGTYTASYTPTNPGDDNIVITMNSTAISGSPFSSTVGLGPADPASSTATVPGTGSAGVVTNITVQARDSEGNALSVGGETVEVTVSGANTEATFEATDVGDGTYAANYTPTALGDDNIVITMNTTAISGSPFTSTVGLGSADPASSTATVPGAGTAGSSTDITVQARDGGGNALNTGGETVEVTVSGANTVATFTATDVGNGTYTASYTPTNTGDDNVVITMNSTAISGSPFTSAVGVGPLSPANSTASVPATGSATVATDITVQARDTEGNAIGVGGEDVEVTVSGANTVATFAATDVGNGTYTASYTPTNTGDDNLVITMNSTAISGSPFTSTVGAGPVSPANSTATVPAAGGAGDATNITVQARDSEGNALSVGGETVEVTVSGANTQATFEATDVGDGTYTASYTPTALGDDNIVITMNSTAINGSPFTSTVGLGSADPASSTATVPGAGTAGSSTDITVQARDGGGNALNTGGETVEVTVSGANTVATFTATDVGNGTYTASYTPTNTGDDNVVITMNSTAISGSPFTSAVGVGPLSPANSTASVPATGSATVATDITVQARDTEGNAIGVGGEDVEVTVSGANTVATFAATDVGNGTYTASYTPTNTGDDNLVITMNSTAISGSPFTSSVGAGPVSPGNSTATVPATGSATVVTNITVQARDSEGNALSVGGETVEVTVSGANTEATFTATDVGDGTYTASYTPTALGDDNIVITMNSVDIDGSPFTSTVGLGPVSPSSSTADVPDGTVGSITNIAIQARDGSGNPLDIGGETVVVTPPTGAVTATDVGDGTYTASYTPISPGNDAVLITMNGTPISGSPFISKVSPAVPMDGPFNRTGGGGPDHGPNSRSLLMSSKPKPGGNGQSPPAKNPFPIAVPNGNKHPRGNRVSRWIRDFLPEESPAPSEVGGPEVKARPKKLHKAPGPIQRATLQMLPGRLEAIGEKKIQQEIRFIQAPTEEQVVTLGWNLGEPPGHVTLNHSSIHPLHAKMTYRDDGWWIENMEEHDPVVVNGAPVRPSSSPRLLADGDQIRIGAILFKFFFP